MRASGNGYLEVVRTLLEAKVDVNAQTNVRNQIMMMMMMIIIIILLTILMMILMMMIVIDEFIIIIDKYDDSK
jgi:uncharacterized membrane protein affecting hemolysin expression